MASLEVASLQPRWGGILAPMPILKIARMGHPVLRRRADRVEDPTAPEIQQLIADMIETMEDAEGAGLAAPQVHVPLRLVVFHAPGTVENEAPVLTVLINPVITPLGDEMDDGWEGCLSIPDIRGVVPRSAAVEVKGFDVEGQQVEFAAEGFFARVLQHEIDHLDSVLFLDRMEGFETLAYFEEFQRYWIEEEEEE